MNKGMICAALVALGLTGPVLARMPATQARADDYSVREDPTPDASATDVQLDGVINRVDVDRDRVTFTTDDGRRYTLDTARSDIILRGTTRPGETADLARGMRIHVDGTRLSNDIIGADRIRVLREAGAPTTRPYPPSVSQDDTDSINLRGTVESVDQRHGSFVVHINQHTRTVFLDDNTDLTGVNRDTLDRVPLRPGDRVTVTGILRPDGTVVADTLSLGRPADAYHGDSGRLRELVGRVTQQSNRYTSRDIKIRVAEDHEVKVHVPSGTPITRDGRPISVHELTKDDVVRISGTSDGDDFRADRITVIRTYDDSD